MREPCPWCEEKVFWKVDSAQPGEHQRVANRMDSHATMWAFLICKVRGRRGWVSPAGEVIKDWPARRAL